MSTDEHGSPTSRFGKSSFPIGEILNSNLGVGDVGTYCLMNMSLSKSVCVETIVMSRISSHDFDVHFYCCNMCCGWARPYQVDLSLVSIFVYWYDAFIVNTSTPTKTPMEMTHYVTHDDQVHYVLAHRLESSYLH